MGETYEILIVGSGPAGLAAGVRAARRGVAHIVLERGRFANTIQRYRRGKWVMAEPAGGALHADLGMHFQAASREDVLAQWQRDAERAGVQIRAGAEFEVVGIDGEKGAFRVRTRGGRDFAARHVVIAIGTSGAPRAFGAPGEHLPHVVHEIEDATSYADQQIVLVGAGDSAIEDAIALAEQDNDVVIVQRRAGFDRAKPANRSAIEAAIRAGHIQEYAHSTVRGFDPGEVCIATPAGEVYLPCDLVIGRLGARPPRGFLESLGIRFDSEDPEALPSTSESYESNVPGIYLVGELVGRPLIKHCLNQGYEVVDHLFGHAVRSAEEPLLREILAPLRMDVDRFIPMLRKQVPLFADLTRRQIEGWLAESRVRVVRAREILYEEGDFGETFFALLEGCVELTADRGASSEEEDADAAPISALLAQGEFFGEDGLLSGRGRVETAVAVTQGVLIESSRTSVLRLASSVAPFAQLLDRAWAIRKLGALFPVLGREECARLTDLAELRAFEPGEVLFREGDLADGLHLVRRGSVVVSRERGGEDRVVNHVSAGSTLGEFALVRPSMQRTATVRASVRTETLRVPAEPVMEVARRYPSLLDDFARSWRLRAVRDEQLLATPGSTSMLDFIIAQGGKDATDLLYIDESLCIRCDNCEAACAATHGGISRLDREAGPRFADVHLPTSCQHCENPLCMTDCPPQALQRHLDGEIFIEDTCIGCGNCAAYCSYGVIKMTELQDVRRPSVLASIFFGSRPRVRPARGTSAAPTHEIAVKCDLCRDLKGRAEGAPVACVAACPTGAIERVPPIELLDRIFARPPRVYPVEDRTSSHEQRESPTSQSTAPAAASEPELVAQAHRLLDQARALTGPPESHADLAVALRAVAQVLERRG